MVRLAKMARATIKAKIAKNKKLGKKAGQTKWLENLEWLEWKTRQNG